jgi:2-amino-4-hydroxy-6-hydroxymethyldihydropteridine diphosphokinase
MPRALLALGANLGDRHVQFERAIASLSSDGEISVVATSTWRETAPIGGAAPQPAYLNGAILVETSLEPHALWRRMAAIETLSGRVRTEHWGPRTLDLDLLLYEERIIQDETLTVPHPRLTLRNFVLEPAAEIAPDMVHPALHRTLAQIWSHVRGTAPFVAIVGDESARQSLAERVAIRCGAQLIAADEDLRRRLIEATESRWVVSPQWSEARHLAGNLMDPSEAFDLALAPRFLITLQDESGRFDPRTWPEALRDRVGPILFLRAEQPDAVEQACLAMQGLSR